MTHCWMIGLMFGLLCGGQTLTIRVYNFANVPAATLERASAVTGELLAEAGVGVIWEDGVQDSLEGRLTVMIPASTPGESDRRGYIVVRVEKRVPAGPSGADLGYALPFAREGVHATVYFDRVERLYFSSTAVPGISALLGAAMAHEIGHVLLGSKEHSTHGIMKARWGPAEFRLLACGRLQFAPADAPGLRAGVAGRLPAQRRLATCAAPVCLTSGLAIR